MSGTCLEGVDHTVEFSKSGDEHVCKVQVTMPDNSVQSFEATCATRHAARLIAVFKASFAVKCAGELSTAPPSRQLDVSTSPNQQDDGSLDSSPKSLDVESREIEPSDNISDMLVDTPSSSEYLSSAEEDEGLRVDRRNNTPKAPIAFVPAPSTPANLPVESHCYDNPEANDLDEVSSLERTLPGNAESPHTRKVLDEAPSQERSRESSDVDEGELIEYTTKYEENGRLDKSRLTPQKRKDPPAGPEPILARSTTSPLSKVSAQRRAALSRSELEAVPKTRSTRTRTSRRLKSNETQASKRPNTRSSGGDGCDSEAQLQDTHHSSTVRGSHLQEPERPRRRRKNPHNAEPSPSECCDYDVNIPRGTNKQKRSIDSELDVTQSDAYGFSPTYHPRPPLHGMMPGAVHPGQVPNPTAPYVSHAVYTATDARQMGYAHQFQVPPVPQVHPSHHMGAPFLPTMPPFATGQSVDPRYSAQPGFQGTMPHALGTFPYQQALYNGANSFYQAQSRTAFHGQQVDEIQMAQREAEIRARVAATMAAEAAEKDAARNAKFDFEADQKAKQASRLRASEATNTKKLGVDGNAAKYEENLTKDSSDGPRSGVVAAERESVNAAKLTKQGLSADSILDDDGDHEDYVSILHRRSQKGTMYRNLSTPSFCVVRSENGGRLGQRCSMSVTFVPDPEKEGTIITKTVLAYKKRKAKQLAAKEILAEIDRLLESQPRRSEKEEGSKEKQIAQKQSNGITTAVAALHRLYSLHVLSTPPWFKPEEPSDGGEKGLWKSVVVLDIKNFGKRTYEAAGSSKKSAKQICAFKALDALKEMKIPEVESFNHVRRDSRDPENCKARDDEDAAPIEAIVTGSDDEKDSHSSVDAEIAQKDDRFVLPREYRVMIPQNVAECEAWVKEYVKSGAHLGLYVDSPRARQVFTASQAAQLSGVTHDSQDSVPRFLCLSTAVSGMVIRFPKPIEGQEQESTHEGDASLPEIVVDTLESFEIKKYGIAFEDGLSVLEYEEDFQSQAVNDISVISLAITGIETVEKNGPLASLPELATLWLRKDAGEISIERALKEKSETLTKLTAEEGNNIIIGVLASYASFCVSQQMTPAARQKRTRVHGVAAAFEQLSKQLMSIAPV